MKYAINKSKNMNICFSENKWENWTEELLVSERYNCIIVNVPYDDAVLTDFEDNKFNEILYLARKQKENETSLRNIRNNLLLAFDKYKSNTILGIEKLENGKIPENIMMWYYKILDLDYESVHNPPEVIKYYI